MFCRSINIDYIINTTPKRDIMNKSELKKTQLLQIFKRFKCMTIGDLCLSLNYSVRSVQRLLKAVGYFSSITHNGKWYT